MKNLRELVKLHPWLSDHLEWHHIPSELCIDGLSANTSLCQKNFLFVALKKSTPTSKDGHDFIDTAIQNGASAVVVDSEFEPKKPLSIPLIKTKDSKTALCHLAEAFYDFPSKNLKIIGITGTNGKTSTSFMLHSILQKAGYNPKIMGTLGVGDPKNLLPSTHTTLEPEFISQTLNGFAQKSTTHVIMEISSHALALKRCEGLKFAAVGLTNITKDHLDFHDTWACYKDAKARLFYELADKDTKIHVPLDHPFDAPFINLDQVSLIESAPLIKSSEHNTQFILSIKNKSRFITLPFLGEFHVKNALLAASIAQGLGVDFDAIAEGLEQCPIIPGRMQAVPNELGFRIFVDFAHTPDGLESLLTSVKQLPHERIILVFGCGGDRDAKKRPIMGALAEKNAHLIIVTDDNPRTESPEKIRNAILDGMQNKKAVVEIAKREKAIHFALTKAQKNDIVVIAGKGHETYQIYSDQEKPFNDIDEAQKVLRSL